MSFKRGSGTLLLTTVLLIVGCSETQTKRYKTIADAERDEAIRRGWLPEVLAPDATDIVEFHDLDSNVGYGTFAMNDSLRRRLEKVCQQPLAVPTPISGLPWWQRILGKQQQATGQTVKCQDFFVKTGSTTGTESFWTSPRIK